MAAHRNEPETQRAEASSLSTCSHWGAQAGSPGCEVSRTTQMAGLFAICLFYALSVKEVKLPSAVPTLNLPPGSRVGDGGAGN